MAKILNSNIKSKKSKGTCGLIYGETSTGKTWLASTGRGKTCIIDICHEKGYEELKSTTFDVETVNTLAEFDKIIANPDKYFSKYDTVVIDNLTQIVTLSEDSWPARKQKTFDFWGDLACRQSGIVTELKKYCKSNNKDLWVIAHQIYDNSRNYDNEIIAPTVFPDVREAAKSKVLAAMDVIIHTFVDGELDIIEDNSGDDIETLITDYCLHIAPHPTYITKCRGVEKLPPKIKVGSKKITLAQLLAKISKLKK